MPESLQRDSQQAFLLNALATAPGRKLRQGQVTRKLQTKAAQAAGLTAPGSMELLLLLQADGLVQVVPANRTTVYELTEAGSARLNQMKDHLPLQQARRAIKAPVNEQVRNYRTGYLLLQVLRGKSGTITEAEANKGLDTYAREGLELNSPTATRLRRDLVGAGLLEIQGHGRGAIYSLTTEGRLTLGNSRFEDGREFRAQGEVLNRLLEAAREVGKQFTPAPAQRCSLPPQEDLELVILDTFGEFCRERHGISGLVPIHEVRSVIRQQFGDAAARHDVFDETILRLWRGRKLGLVPITDPSKATPDQLRDSIPGQGDTLFYLEAAHEPAPV